MVVKWPKSEVVFFELTQTINKIPVLLRLLAKKSVFQFFIIFICFYFSGNYPTPPPSEIKWAPEKWTDIFLVVPVICFGYQCHVSVIPIYSCMKNRNLKHFSGKKVYHGKFLLSWTQVSGSLFAPSQKVEKLSHPF
jgi:hypothetical protein